MKNITSNIELEHLLPRTLNDRHIVDPKAAVYMPQLSHPDSIQPASASKQVYNDGISFFCGGKSASYNQSRPKYITLHKLARHAKTDSGREIQTAPLDLYLHTQRKYNYKGH